MNEARSAGADPSISLGLGDSLHSRRQRFAAVATCLALVGIALLAMKFGSVQGPEIKPFLPIVATIWALADLMTAFLLLAQFYVNGTTFFTVLAAAYGLSGLLTGPYLLAFPGLFRSGHLPVTDQQISVCIWSLWHATFPIVVAISMLSDSKFRLRTYSRTAKRSAVASTILITLCVAGAITALVSAERLSLPLLITNGHFTPLFSHFVAPALASLNAFACSLLLRRRREITTLELWLFVATFTAMLDTLLNSVAPSRYSYGWYIGKLETVTTASVVLGVLLCEVTGLYRRLAEMATIDSLTQLYNRRALDDHMRVVFGRTKRQPAGLGLLVVDVDLFKGYNDGYGHAQGDDCLRQIAAILKSVATRPLDLTARYGGEEFVVVMPDTPRAGAVAVAERIIEFVEAAAIPYGNYSRGHVTVSAGIGYVADAFGADGVRLFEIADRALYEAKARGRNTFVVDDYERATAEVATAEVAAAELVTS